MKEPYRILALSDSILTVTGFATVTRDLFTRLAKYPEYDITVVGHNFNAAQPIERLEMNWPSPVIQHQQIEDVKLLDSVEIPLKIYPGGLRPYASDMMPIYFQKFQPDVFWVLLDTFMMYQANYHMANIPSKFIMYFPSDGGYFPWDCEKILQKAYLPVAMSKYAQKQAADLFNIKTDYIPHGVDTNLYYKLPKKNREDLRMAYGIPEDAFVVGSVARNQGRKNMGTLVESFALFAKGKDDVFLFLHTDPDDVAALSVGMNLRDLIKLLGIEHKVIFSGMKFFLGVKVEDMINIYNMMDIHALTTTGEGFGIPTIEAMSCEVPSVITDYTTSAELTSDGKVGILVPVAAETWGTWNVKRAFVNAQEFANHLQKAYDDRNLVRKMGKESRKKCIKEYDWDSQVFPTWKKTIDRVLEE